MSISIAEADITTFTADAIVNAANTQLAHGGGVCGAIFKAAGARKLRKACGELSPIKTGEAVITPGFALRSRYIIHAVGPIYSPQSPEKSERLLRLTYTNALKCAVQNGCQSVVFPLISSGIYGYPAADALRVATSAILEFLREQDLEVTLVLLGEAALNAWKEFRW